MKPIEKEIRRLLIERGCTDVVSIDGRRAEESSDRAAMSEFWKDEGLSLSKRITRNWYRWLPIHKLRRDEVFQVIEDSGEKPHWIYETGMERCSCCFCIYSSDADIKLAAKLRPDLLNDLSALEAETGFTFKMPVKNIKRTLEQIVQYEKV